MTSTPPPEDNTPADTHEPREGAREGAREGERIAKLLARAGIASRREVERMIAEGRVRIGDDVVTTPATVLPNLRGITVDGRPVRAAEPSRLFIFHKPQGLITAESDPAGRPTIYTALRNALPPGTPRLMPVGRLDLNTEGLLLLTNDGELKRAMELPSSGIPRTYRARTFGDISQAQLEELIEGVEIEGIRYGRIDANMERRTGRNQWIEMTITEGKNREVRRVLEHLGLQVSRLLRISYGPFVLGDLPRGMAGEVRQVDVEKFRRNYRLPDASAQAISVSSPPPRGAAPAATTSRERPAGSRPASARGAPPSRNERPSRDERSFRSERPSRDERPFRSERPARDERPFRSERPARDERPFRSERPSRDERPAREERPFRNERSSRNGPSRNEPAGRDSRPVRGERREWSAPADTDRRGAKGPRAPGRTNPRADKAATPHPSRTNPDTGRRILVRSTHDREDAMQGRSGNRAPAARGQTRGDSAEHGRDRPIRGERGSHRSDGHRSDGHRPDGHGPRRSGPQGARPGPGGPRSSPRGPRK